MSDSNAFVPKIGARFTVFRRFSFDAAHHLPNVPAGHKCGRVHGHTYGLTLGVRGPIDPGTGWVLDYAELDRIYREKVHAVLDHHDLNEITPNPTCEVLAAWIAWRVARALPPLVELVRVELRETESSGVVYEP